MTHFFTEKEIKRLKNAPADSLQARLFRTFRAQTYADTRFPGISQPGDIREWYHTCQARCENAAFLWYLERDEALGKWVHDAALWLRDQDATEWIGPWFRDHSQPYVGMLETAHITKAVCGILDMAGELFTAEEKESLLLALREKGMVPCRRFCDEVLAGKRKFNNFYHVIFGGYARAALLTEDREATEYVLKNVLRCADMYSGDSYGETLHYSDFASTNYCWVNEYILRLLPQAADKVDMQCYGRLMKWFAASFLHMKPYFDPDIPFPRSFDFGDSGAVFRAEGDLLVHIAVRLKDTLPQEAALASWLMHTTYAPLCTEDVRIISQVSRHCGNMSAFVGFFALLMLPDMAAPQSPRELGMPLMNRFHNGDVFLRDQWDHPTAALAIKGGYGPQQVTNHRHQDLGSFIFMRGRERMIIDGGTTCYRLQSKDYAASCLNHAVIDFVGERQGAGFGMPLDPYEGVVQQRLADGDYLNPRPSRAVTLRDEAHGKQHILSMDLSLAYGEDFGRVRRAFVLAFPDAFFLIDQAETREEWRMRAHFPMNNRDGALKACREDDHHYTFSRFGDAVKISECLCLLDGREAPSQLEFAWGYCNSNQTLLPNQEGQGKEGSASIYNWLDSKPVKNHLRVCAVTGASAARIGGWKAEQNKAGDWVILSPEKQDILSIRVKGNDIFLVQGEKLFPVF